MSETIAVALIASIPTLVISVLTLIFNYQNNLIVQNKQDSREFITKQRIVWTETIRQEVSKYIALLRDLHNYKAINFKYFEGERKDLIKEEYLNFINIIGEKITVINEKKTLIILRLNPFDDKDLIESINTYTNNIISEKADLDTHQKAIDEITYCFHNVLKKEWEKIKKEVEYKV